MSEYAKYFIGTKYTWGGDSAEEGYDCSGFIQELIKSNWDYVGDRTAQDIFYYLSDKFLADQINSPRNVETDDIIFYGKNLSNITHVALALDKYQVIEAGGEGRTPTTKGMVRVRPLKLRSDFLCAVRIYK